MTTIFVVSGRVQRYDTFRTWQVKAFDQQDDALIFAHLLGLETALLFEDYQREDDRSEFGIDEDTIRKNFSTKLDPRFDPSEFYAQYTTYVVSEVELQWH